VWCRISGIGRRANQGYPDSRAEHSNERSNVTPGEGVDPQVREVLPPLAKDGSILVHRDGASHEAASGEKGDRNRERGRDESHRQTGRIARQRQSDELERNQPGEKHGETRCSRVDNHPGRRPA
jgi:hypothetical protein